MRIFRLIPRIILVVTRQPSPTRTQVGGPASQGAPPQPVPDFPEAAIAQLLDNTWGDTGKALFNNWLGLVYQLTDLDRKTAFCPGIDPDDPLGMNSLALKA